ncbi:MAG: DUF1501 domain-containing protein [Bacteroidia bacterium]
MKRRSFIKNTAAAASIPLLLGGMGVQALGRNTLLNNMMEGCDPDRILVLIQLNGGNDGLNTLLPLDQYSNLSTARGNILIPDNKALSLTPETGLHPAMTGLENLYKDDKLGVVQAVGYPNPNFSHFRSTDIWTTGSPADEIWETGWVGRYLEDRYPGYPTGYPNSTTPDPLAITLGAVVSQTCQGPVTNMSMAMDPGANFEQLLTGCSTTPAPANPYGTELSFLRQSVTQTNAYLTALEDAFNNGNNMSGMYPATGNNLANQLKLVAKLINGGLKTQFYICNIGGFDTHAAQVDTADTTQGIHANLLGQLSTAIEAFQDDLKLMSREEDVLGLTFSEFGRRIASNGSTGTDHGAGAPLFLFGTEVNPMIHGTNPTIAAQVEPNDNIPMQFDFRSIYGSVLQDWFCVEEADIKNLMFDEYQHIPVLKNTFTAVEDLIGSGKIVLGQNYPNPAEGYTRIPLKLEDSQFVSLTLFNGNGQLIKVISERQFAAGEHQIDVDLNGLAAGMYHYRMQIGDQSAMKSMIVKK